MSESIPSSITAPDVLAATLEPLGVWPPGAIIFVPDGWQGAWDIRETVRKTCTIVQTTPPSHG